MVKDDDDGMELDGEEEAAIGPGAGVGLHGRYQELGRWSRQELDVGPEDTAHGLGNENNSSTVFSTKYQSVAPAEGGHSITISIHMESYSIRLSCFGLMKNSRDGKSMVLTWPSCLWSTSGQALDLIHGKKFLSLEGHSLNANGTELVRLSCNLNADALCLLLGKLVPVWTLTVIHEILEKFGYGDAEGVASTGIDLSWRLC
ncbi:hypothetical protein COCNU_scaffold010294G000030 [Cocos nucifera]|nr:hypothetical protein [Cocos nucifera]